MARMKKKKKEVVLTKENLLIQPVALTLRGINPTVIGNRVTIAVVKKLREAFKEIISKHKTGEEWKQLSIFATDEVKNKYLGENKLAFDIHMNEIVDDPKHYQDAFNAVCKIADVMVWAPIANENGEVTMARTPLFTLLAKSNMEETINEKTGEVVYRYSKHTKPVIGLAMEKVVAEYIFSFQKGYTDFLDYPALQANDKYYYPIYAFLSFYKKDTPPEVVIDYPEFRKRLGFEDKVKDGETVYVGYDVFSQFNKRVLKPCMDEMKENAESNISDIWFEVEKIYLNGRAPNPDKLKFIIHLSDLGETILTDKTATKDVMEMEKRLREVFKQTNKQIRTIMKGVPVKYRDLLKRKMNELSAAKNSGKLKIESDEGAYWNVAFTNFIEKMKMQVQGEKLPFEEEVEPMTTEKNHSDGTDKEVSALSEADVQKWGRVQLGLQSAMTEEEYHTWFGSGAIRLVSVSEGMMTCEVPTRSYLEIMMAKHGGLLKQCIEKEWGSGCEIHFTTKR